TDRHGEFLWGNRSFQQTIQGGTVRAGQPLRERFAPASAALLERLFRDPNLGERGRVGRLILELAAGGTEDLSDTAQHLVAYWLTVALPEGTGVLFAFRSDWESLCPPDDLAAEWQRTAARPRASALPLFLR